MPTWQRGHPAAETHYGDENAARQNTQDRNYTHKQQTKKDTSTMTTGKHTAPAAPAQNPSANPDGGATRIPDTDRSEEGRAGFKAAENTASPLRQAEMTTARTRRGAGATARVRPATP